jgi:predicted metal-dependent hydrolase
LYSKKYSSDNTTSKVEQRQQSNQIFRYGNKIVDYTLIKSKRRKTSEIIVDKNSNIILRVPFEKTISEIELILNDKIKWAISKQREYNKEIKEIVPPTFENNSTLPYLGKNYELQIVYYDNDEDYYIKQKEKIYFIDNRFIVYIYDNSDERSTTDNNIATTNQIENVSKLFNDWLISEAHKIFLNKVNEYKKLVGVTPKNIVIKQLRNRWGSLTKKDDIHLNFHLIKAPEDIIDYIIIHELCHLKIKGHSHIFWNYLKQFVPDYEQKRKWLDGNTDNILGL